MATQTRARKTPAKPKAIPTPNQREREENFLVGNLTADPELRFTPSGVAVSNMRMAVTDRYFDEETEQWEDAETEFYGLTAWRQQAENCAESLHRGDRIVATGEWKVREYENAEGQLVSVREFTVRECGPSLLFRAVDIQQPIPRRSKAASRPNQKQRVEAVQDPWEDGDEPPF